MNTISQRSAPFFNFEKTFTGFVQRTDWFSPLILLVLSAWSVAAIYSMGNLRTSWDESYASKQLIYIAVGWAVYWAAAFVNSKTYARHAHWIYIAGIVLLVPIAICAIFHVDVGTIITARGGAPVV